MTEQKADFPIFLEQNVSYWIEADNKKSFQTSNTRNKEYHFIERLQNIILLYIAIVF